ncbi:MAG: phospholipase D-like domain-containing protein [Bacteroidota bacterium]
MLTEVDMGGSTADHSITLTDLEPAEFYYVEVSSSNGNTTTTSTTKLFSTASNSTGEVRVYFNFEVDANFSNGSNPTALTSAAMEAAIIERINAATTSIDVSVYNNNRETIVQALANAYNNGVQVRYIADDETANLALSNPQPPFPVVKGNNGSPLMHNKFFVFDADSQNDSWVISGSTNMTSQNLAEDYNNTVFIQDQALAKAYRLEFEEMWGSTGQNPGIFNVKFGESKKDNTPHLFNINGMMVESYFSPSDRTTVNIVNAIKTANTDVEFALLTFTNNELGNAILEAHNSGIQVRGIIDNVNDQGSEFDYLDGNGVNVSPDNTSEQTHHKYALVDATNASSDPMVITGSHNWSASAEVRNDENTLIIHDADIANIFLQEFEARWCEATGGTNCTLVSNQEVDQIEGFEANLFPNPALDYSNIRMELSDRKTVQISLWDVQGRLIQSSLLRNIVGTTDHQLRLEGLPSGNYLVDFKVDDQHAVKILQIK